MSKSSEVQQVPESAYALVKAATNDRQRFDAGAYAVGTIEVPGIDRPVPRFVFDLPWVKEGADATADILAHLAAATDIEEATNARELRKAKTLVGDRLEVLGLLVAASDIEDAVWGVYLRLTVRVNGGAPEVINVGAPQVMVTLWRCYCDGLMPVTGELVALGTPKKGQDPALGFRVESSLD